MNLKIATFNISGGLFQEDDSKDFLDKQKTDKIDNRLLNEIIKNINENDIDIICFQEIITTQSINYIKQITDNTNLKYEQHFELGPCHIIKDTNDGIAILSKYPIENAQKEFFINPKLSKTTSSGNTYYTYDKGYLIADININGKSVTILTHIGFPYRRFNADPLEYKNVFEEFDNVIEKSNLDIITGDFNAEKFIDMMPYTNNNYIKTTNEGTTTDGMKFDNILVKKSVKYNSNIIKSLSDHYMVLTEIEF